MKSLILSAAFLLTIVLNAVAADAAPDNEKVVKTFNDVFKSASNVTWSNVANNFEAYFTVANVKTRALIDKKGNLIQTIRYFKEDMLPSNVLYNIKKDYPGKNVWGVTEVTNKNGVNYRVILKDENNYTHINANSAGDTEQVAKYKRGDK